MHVHLCAGRVCAPTLRYFNVCQRHELLPAMQIGVAQISLKDDSRNTEFKGTRVVSLKKAHFIRRTFI
jgi:hypothetical protein